MVELAMASEGVYGARMMGGGFGGCTINLVRSDYVESFKLTVSEAYEAIHRYESQTFTSVPLPMEWADGLTGIAHGCARHDESNPIDNSPHRRFKSLIQNGCWLRLTAPSDPGKASSKHSSPYPSDL